MDIIQLYQDYNVTFLTEGHKHCRPGWVQVPCPFCTGNEGWHLGYELETDHYSCYRCGWHSVDEVLVKLLNLSFKEVKVIIKQYGGSAVRSLKEPAVKVKSQRFKLPSHSEELQKIHIQYLIQRGFDPDKLTAEWGLLGTGPISTLSYTSLKLTKVLNYRFRIIIPFLWNKKMISFDSRDVTRKHLAKYMACPNELEVVDHKSILYGKQSEWGEVGICVEGPSDVWRMGVHSFATSGIKYTPKQVREIAKQFRRVAVMFDGPSETSQELQAAEQANKLVADLKFRGVDAFRVIIKGDPGELPQKEADYLVKQIIH